MKAQLQPSSRKRRKKEERSDVVFDFAGIGSPDLGALCLMLTARNLADDSHRRVWLHGLPEPTWKLLEALGLEHYFEFLPASEEASN
jgi:ABC-type transporter Mla MlaB component